MPCGPFGMGHNRAALKKLWRFPGKPIPERLKGKYTTDASQVQTPAMRALLRGYNRMYGGD